MLILVLGLSAAQEHKAMPCGCRTLENVSETALSAAALASHICTTAAKLLSTGNCCSRRQKAGDKTGLFHRQRPRLLAAAFELINGSRVTSQAAWFLPHQSNAGTQRCQPARNIVRLAPV